MGMTQKELNAHLQRHGLFPDKHALMLLKEHTDKVLDQKTELAAVVLHVKNNPGLVKNKVTKEIMEEALAAEGDTENDKGENLMILDHKSVPISVYDSVRKVFVRKAGSDRSLQDNIDPITRIQAFRERFELVEQRVLNNHVFAKKSFATDEYAGARPDLTRISGIRRAEGRVCILGLLTQPQEGTFFLEDMSGRVELDITEAESNIGLFTENCIIIVEGEMNGDVFKALGLAMPPAEDREKTCKRFPTIAVPTNRKPYTPEELETLKLAEAQQVGTQIVVLSDVWLDRPRVMSGLKKLFGRFDIACQNLEADQDAFFLFVLMGNFVSQPALHGIGTHKELFGKLAALIVSFEALLPKACFVFVPGPNDIVCGRAFTKSNPLMLPRNTLPDVIAKDFKDKIPASTFTSDPCRITFYTQEIVLHRDDVCAKMRKYSRKPTEGPALQDHTVRTLLSQGHLAPLPLHAAPIDWAYDHALRLYPLPSLLVLGDRQSSYETHYQKTLVANPGCFASGFSFMLYTPAERDVEILYIDQVDEIPDSERLRRAEEMAATKKKLKDKKRKDKADKAARELGLDTAGNALDKLSKKLSKTPQTRKKPQVRDGISEEKGAITSFFLRRPAQIEDEDGARERKRRRLRPRGDGESDHSNDSEDESNADEDGEESSDSEEAHDDAADTQESDEDESEAVSKLQRRAPVARHSGKGRLADSDEEEEVADSVRKVKIGAAVGKSASDDVEEFVYKPSAGASGFNASLY